MARVWRGISWLQSDVLYLMRKFPLIQCNVEKVKTWLWPTSQVCHGCFGSNIHYWLWVRTSLAKMCHCYNGVKDAAARRCWHITVRPIQEASYHPKACCSYCIICWLWNKSCICTWRIPSWNCVLVGTFSTIWQINIYRDLLDFLCLYSISGSPFQCFGY